MSKKVVIIFFLLFFPKLVFAYGSGTYGSVMYGGLSESVIDAEMTLTLQAALSNGNNTNTQDLLSLLAQATDSIEGTRTFTMALILSAISQMEQTNIIDAYAAQVLSAAVAQSHIMGQNINSILVLTGYVSQSHVGDIDQISEVVLSSIASMTITHNTAFFSDLTLDAQAGLTNAAAVINAAVVELSAQGQFSEAAVLLAYGSMILNVVASTGQTSNVGWQTMLTLSSQADIELQAYMMGTAYDVYLTLTSAANIATQSNVDFISELTLSAQADMSMLLASVIKEGIVTLTAQGNIESASQLAYLGSIILQAMVIKTPASNQIFLEVPVILGAIASFVQGSSSGLEGMVVRIRALMLSPDAGFTIKQPATIFQIVR